ncbi:VCBS domain-containing protein [soil metagenome]
MSILFTNGDNETDGGALELDGASFITSADVGGTTYVFVAGGVDNGISVFTLGLNGALTNTANVTDGGALNLVGVSGLTTITSNGATYLVAAGAGDNGLSVFRVSTGGALTSVHDVVDAGSLNLGGVSRVASATVSGNAYVFAAGTNDDGISVFRVQGNGKLTSVQNLSDNGTLELDGVKGLSTATIGGNVFLFAAGGVDDGVSVFNVAANGTLINTSNVTDDATLKLDGASDVATAVVGGVTYLFVTGAVDNGVSVFSVNASGVLTNVANVTDAAALRLAGATGVTASLFGATTYLTVGGTENGVSVFRVNTGGSLTLMENIDDAGARELGGTSQVHTATVGGANFVVGAGATDDGVSTFGLHPTGQLWFTTEGGDADTRIVRVNNDGSSQTIAIDNTPATDPLPSSFQADVCLDTSAGFYFGLSNSGTFGDHAFLVRGVIGSAATPTIVIDFPDSVITNGIQVDAINHRIYVGYQHGSGSAPANTGIRQYTYNPLTGALTDNGFLVTAATDTRGQESGFDLLDPRDFALDSSIGRLFYTELLTGGAASIGLFRLDLASPSTTTQLVSQAQFPDSGVNGYIYDVEVDQTTDLVYFTTQSNAPSPDAGYNASHNALWYISENASSGTAVKVTLVGAVGATFYPGDMTFDQNLRQLYIESEEGGTGSADDVIYVFQLDGAGSTATLLNTFFPSPTFISAGANIQGMVFSQLPTLGSLNGTSSPMAEQAGAGTVLLNGAPSITDFDGDHLASATVQITGGRFASNESSTSDDHLAYGPALQISGLISGTNITVSWNAATETMTFSGYDTLANYQAVLAAVRFYSSGDNPANYGLNTTRTLTWTVSDGTPDIPGGSINSGTTQITLAPINDAPVNGAVTSATGNEGTNIAVTGLQISDADANPALQTVTVTMSVTKGVLTLLTNVSDGLTGGEITGNGTATVTISATLNEINATLAASNGVLFTGNPGVSGADTLTVVTNDGGGSGSGGAQSDTDAYTITIIGVNDAPTVGGDGAESLAPTNEDVTNAALTNTVSTLFSGQYSDADSDAFAGVAVIANGSTAGTGQWQYHNGSTWVNIGAASTASAVTLAVGAPLRFLSAADYNGAAPTLTVKLVDASGGALTNGSVVNVTTSGGATSYSAGTVVLDHAVTAVNDAPVTTGGAAVTLTTIGEDSAPGAGQTVSALFASHFSDVKDQVSGGSSANALAGVGVTSNTATGAQGVYQYFSGGAWHDLPAVSTSSALVLGASTLVRFVPAADYSGAPPSLTVYMIEDSLGAVTTGATADLTTTGGATPYGTAMTLGITVTATNDAPIPSGAATLATINEDTAAPGGQTVSTIFGSHFTDPDGDTLAGVAITGNAASTQGVWQYFNGAWININAPSEGAALVLAAGTLVRFLAAPNYNGATPALTAYLIDSSGGAVTTGSLLDVSVNGGQTRFSDTSLSLTSSITAVNDTPTVPATATTVGATEQVAATLLGAVTVSDVDLDNRNGGNGDYGGASFTVQRASANAIDTFAFGASGLFTVSGGNLQVGGLTFATFTSAGGVLTISFTSSAATATTALVNDVIDHIRYTVASDAPPSSVTLNYALNDGAPGNAGQGSGGAASAGGSVIVNITAVNDPHTGGASVSGTPAEDQVLTAISTLADPDGIGALHYQWQHDVGCGYVNVGADQSVYALGDGDIGGVVRVVAYYTDAGGTVESATSAATAAVGASNDAPTGGVSIIGTATENQVLTADTSTLADSDGLGTLHYDWQRNVGSGYASIGAPDQTTYTLGDADVGGLVRVVVGYIDGQGFANTVTSAGSAAIAAVNDPHTGGAAISGTAAQDQVLTAVSTLADVDGLGPLHYQWQHDVGSGYVNVGADQPTYTLGAGDVGGVVRVVIAYTDGQGFAESATSAGTPAITNVNHSPTGGVSISGATTENQVLTAVTASLADADGLGTLHYQWTRGVGPGTVNVGTDQATYTLGDADVGKLIGVKVSYTDQHGTAEQVSVVGTSFIAGVNDPHTGGAAITGTATEDQVLTAVSTLADADGLGALHYQWQHNVGSGYVNAGTDQSTYTLGDADVGGTVRVVISYTDGQGFAESATSAGTAAIANLNDPHTGGVSITGAATQNQVLTANTATLADADGLGTLHYQWQRDSGSGFANVGADQSTYTLGAGDVGGVMRVVTSYVDQQGTAESATSAATAAIIASNGPHTGGVTITGVVTEDQVLTANTSTLADPGGLGTLHYQWQRDSGSGFANVGADQTTYTLGDADVGAAVRVVVSYVDGGGVAESAASAATAAVANLNDAPVAVGDGAAVVQRLSTSGTVRANDSDVDNAASALTVTNVAFNFTHVDQAVVAGGTAVTGGFGVLTLNPDGAYTYVANQEGLHVGQVVTDKFDYVLKDPSGASATAQLTVTITGSATGDANANLIISDAAGDTLVGKGGADTLTGGGGNDVFAYEVASDSTLAAYDTITDFAHGQDSLRLTPLITGTTKVTLATDGANQFVYVDQNADGTAESLIVAQGQGLQASDIVTGLANFGFTIYGSAGADSLVGGSGADVIAGYGGADTLRGGGGADFLYGGVGADTFIYGAGDSTLLNWDVIADFVSGQDKVNVSATDGGHVVIARLGSSSFVYFGGAGVGFSTVQVLGAIQADDLIMSGAGVTIFGSYGAETLRGGAGKDVLVGGIGTTTLIGGDNADTLYGGLGTDTFVYQSASQSNFATFDLIVNFDYGHDKIDISAIDSGKITLARYGGNTFVYSAPDGGGNFQSAIAVQGTDLKSTDLIISGGANQSFTLVGDGASHNVADSLTAAGGNDILYGLDGADTLIGNGGADFLVGGTGADTFVFKATTDSSSFASDLVFDFSSAEGDRIDLRGIDAQTGGSDNAFTVVTAFSNAAGQLIIGAADGSGVSHLSGDVNGDGIADFIIALNVTTTLTTPDILL